jgi:F0F1-type ATP synthase assembly protein I
VAQPPDDRTPIAIAVQWSATIMTISLEMVVPGLIGYWLDQQFGTRVVFLLIGFALGGILATLALMRIAKNRSEPGGGRKNVEQSNHDPVE